MTFYFTDSASGLTGYSKAVRELALALSKHMDVKLMGNQMGYLPDRFRGLMLTEMPVTGKDDLALGRLYFSDFATNQLTQGASPFLGKKIGQFVLESTRLPERLVSEANSSNIIRNWVPSRHCKHYAVESGCIEDKIDIIPHGYDPKVFKYKKTSNDTYTFLFVGGYTGKGDRKGADLLAEAFHKEFKPEEKVKLVMKINTCYGEFPKEDLDIDSRIEIDTRELTDEQMVSVYQQADCFVSPSAGEGFNMTVLEAMACGLPVITGTFGGHQDYIHELDPEHDRTTPLEGNMKPARYSPWDCGLWNYPTLMDLRIVLSSFYENKPNVEKYKNIENWTWDKAALKAKTVIDKVLQ